MATRYNDFNKTYKRGDTIKFEFQLKWSDSGLAIPPASLTEIWFTGKKRESDTDAQAVFQKKLTGGSVTNGITTTDGPNGKYRAVVPATEAAILALTQTTILYCDVQVKIASDSEVKTVTEGRITLEVDITQATS